MRLFNEKGVFIPLVAVTLTGVLGVLMYLGFDSWRSKRSSTRLSGLTKQICSSLASEPTLHAASIQSFYDQVVIAKATNELKNMELTGAYLYMPTMPSNFCLPNDGGCTPEDPIISDPDGIDFSDPRLLGPGNDCSLPCLAGSCDCKFFGTVDVNNPHNPFPDLVWDNTKNPGNMVACQLTGKFTNLLGEEKIVAAREIYTKRLRGNFNFDLTEGDPDIIVDEFPGVRIAIAPYVTTKVGDYRFRFPEEGSVLWNGGIHGDDIAEYPVGASAPWDKFYDPLYQFHQPGNRVKSFAYRPLAGQRPYNLPKPRTGYEMERPPGFSATCRYHDKLLDNPVDNCADPSQIWLDRTPLPPQLGDNAIDRELTTYRWTDAVQGCEQPDADPADCVLFSDREEMLAACMNPVSLIRNQFLSTIAEMLSRNASTRKNSQFLFVPPQHLPRGVNYNDPGALPLRDNNPIIMIDFGQDLANPTRTELFQLPFVSFDTGTREEPPGRVFGSPVSGGIGYVNPFRRSPTNDHLEEQFTKYQALLANQVRYCSHMFSGSNSGIERHPATGINFVNDAYEPNDAFGFEDNLRDPYGPMVNKSWDQDFPWVRSGFPDGTWNFSAAELMSSIGNVQLCPAEIGGVPLHAPPVIHRWCSGVIFTSDTAPGTCDDISGLAGVHSDTDGLDDATDNCPTIDNPIQEDFDNDNIGDVCDPDYSHATPNRTGVCQKPFQPVIPFDPADPGNPDQLLPNDLRADILGLIRYFAGENKAIGGAASAVGDPADGHTGLFPLISPADPFSAPGGLPLGDQDYYRDVQHNEAPVLLFTHQVISETEADAIRPYFDPSFGTGAPLQNVPFTIVYMPIYEDNRFQHERIAVPRFKHAFFIEDDEISAATANRNVLIVFSPNQADYNMEWSGEGFDIWQAELILDARTHPEPERYRRYWNYILSFAEENVVLSASNIVNYRLQNTEVKF